MAKKIRIWYRAQRKKWYGEYWANGKRYAKSFLSKRDAQLWKSYMEHKFNYEEWQGVKVIPWTEAIELYILHKEAEGRTTKTVTDVENSLTYFKDITRIETTRQLNQWLLNDFKVKRKKYFQRNPKSKSAATRKVTNQTINKDLRNLKAFYNWLIENHFCNTELKFKMLPTVKNPFIPPTQKQIRDLLLYSKEHPPLYMRIILAIETGLRRSAIENLTLSTKNKSFVDIGNNVLVTYESKTKEYIFKYLGDNAIRLLCNYIATLPEGSKKLFRDPWDGKTRSVFEKIRAKAGLPNLKFHNLRNLSVSYLADKGESAVILQHHTS